MPFAFLRLARILQTQPVGTPIIALRRSEEAVVCPSVNSCSCTSSQVVACRNSRTIVFNLPTARGPAVFSCVPVLYIVLRYACKELSLEGYTVVKEVRTRSEDERVTKSEKQKVSDRREGASLNLTNKHWTDWIRGGNCLNTLKGQMWLAPESSLLSILNRDARSRLAYNIPALTNYWSMLFLCPCMMVRAVHRAQLMNDSNSYVDWQRT